MSAELVKRLEADAVQLRKMVQQTAFAGNETGVRVKSPDFLLRDLDEAAATITALEQQVAGLRKELDTVGEALRDEVTARLDAEHRVETAERKLAIADDTAAVLTGELRKAQEALEFYGNPETYRNRTLAEQRALTGEDPTTAITSSVYCVEAPIGHALSDIQMDYAGRRARATLAQGSKPLAGGGDE